MLVSSGVKLTFRSRVSLLVGIRYEGAETAHVDNARARGPDSRPRQFTLVLLPVDLHVGNAGLRHDKGPREVGLDVRMPLVEHGLVRHSFPVRPVRVCDAGVVDQEVDAVVQKFGRPPDRAADRIDVTEVADRPADLRRVFFEMLLGRVPDAVLVDVEDEDLVPATCKVSCNGSSNSCWDGFASVDFHREDLGVRQGCWLLTLAGTTYDDPRLAL